MEENGDGPLLRQIQAWKEIADGNGNFHHAKTEKHISRKVEFSKANNE